MSRRVEHPRIEAERRVAPWRRRKNEANNNKFAFLKPGDPFNPYYAEQVVANGGKPPAGAADAAASAKISGESTVKPVKKAAAGVIPLEPPKPQYIVNRPAGAQPLESAAPTAYPPPKRH